MTGCGLRPPLTKNRERLLRGDIAAHFFAALLDQARDYELLSDEPFTVDGTLLEAVASLKSFKPKDEINEPRRADVIVMNFCRWMK